ncbi:MAG: YggS family pyridoxal phosphate-dependent enzyme [Bacteroides sp.]|nr:YggS family pyridoxal phosphate-dependent enzyme [Bacteroides sp.]MDD2645524.1 YggS family pyridoxal phosphate-dependent enzyme [Bacteroides sp.]MDD4054684.1 YggS family pyridoxal phosphate-dependent enzyme [Bacteroides sp.]MDD4720130.1 YggS family pyridoxal phosphate-dependent enzyme [Bacteroides sp.]NLI64329.1 YggS family pyridoxal phosphate-dependent enzyme [Bacteroidales bacterium]
MTIATQLNELKANIPDSVKLIAVSKYHSADTIMEAYNEGHRLFGESRVQELVEKKELLPDDIEWHFIGHLQRNKVRDIVPFVSMIHGVDSLRLLREINKRAKQINKTIPCLIQLHIADESSKFGFSFDECRELLASNEWSKFQHVKICGVMGMATFTDNEKQVKSEFKSLYRFFHEIKEQYFTNDRFFCEVSMGMSQDYTLAIEEGSTMIRIGTAVFGEREY